MIETGETNKNLPFIPEFFGGKFQVCGLKTKIEEKKGRKNWKLRKKTEKKQFKVKNSGLPILKVLKKCWKNFKTGSCCFLQYLPFLNDQTSMSKKRENENFKR